MRGEIYMPKASFEAVNDSAHKKGEKGFMNPRNAAVSPYQELEPVQKEMFTWGINGKLD